MKLLALLLTTVALCGAQKPLDFSGQYSRTQKQPDTVTAANTLALCSVVECSPIQAISFGSLTQEETFVFENMVTLHTNGVLKMGGKTLIDEAGNVAGTPQQLRDALLIIGKALGLK
jgi:hypothetical protein